MLLNVDNDILQDFLVEAGEILEKLGEQLVELEHRPTDQELLNAVFRSFHTIKGGAGFLNISPLVEVCHRAEDVFNTLRQGQRVVDADLMDVVLKVTDIVNSMMECIRRCEMPKSTDNALLKRLQRLALPEPGKATKSNSNRAKPTDHADKDNNLELDSVEELKMVQDSATKMVQSPRSRTGKRRRKLEESPEGNTKRESKPLLDKLQRENDLSGKTITESLIGDRATKAGRPTAEQGEDSINADNAGNASLTDVVRDKGKHKPTTTSRIQQKGDETVSAEDALVIAGRINADGDVNPDTKKEIPIKDRGAQTQAESTVRVHTKRLDDIMNLVGELVLVRNRLETLKVNMGNDDVAQAVSNLDVVTSDLQATVMKTRMQPIRKVFSRFPRVVRDLSRSLDREIELELVGEDTDLDKNLVEALADPLVHLVRNSVDHGIESAEVRQSLGKNRVGKIMLSAKQEGDHILLTIKDDGAGMNADKLRSKAIEKGLLDAESASRLDERECYNLIFLPGFSTKAEISDISGRGVGMDVVKTRITQLNGNVEVSSTEGVGTEIKVKLPLTLAIVPTLMVVVGEQIFAIPLANVNEIMQFESVRKNVVDGKPVAIVREHPLPLYYLRNWLIRNPSDNGVSNESSYVVVIKIGTSHIACVVDHLISQEEVVIKPLGALLHGLPGLAGATITGDGRIAIILDMPSLISHYGGRSN